MSATIRRRYAVTLAVACSVCLAGGCPSAPPPQEDVGEGIELEVIDKQAFDQVLRRHRGKVVLVDFWATWCQSCVELFPHSVELHRRHADRGLAVISVSIDKPDEGRAAALQFLTRQGAEFQNFISPYGAGTRSTEAFGLDGPLPQMKLYDRQGRLHARFGGTSGEVDLEQLDRSVERLLAES